MGRFKEVMLMGFREPLFSVGPSEEAINKHKGSPRGWAELVRGAGVSTFP